jgi:hypothetical protein
MKVGIFLELSASTVAFISCRGRLTKILAGAARDKTRSKCGGGQVGLSDIDTWELAGFDLSRFSFYTTIFTFFVKHSSSQEKI